MHGGIVFSGGFFVFFLLYTLARVYGLFFFTRVVWHIYQRKRSFTGNITSSQTKKNEKDASIFMEVFIVFLFFFLLMIRLFECRFMIH